jgi:hypothetical protein
MMDAFLNIFIYKFTKESFVFEINICETEYFILLGKLLIKRYTDFSIRSIKICKAYFLNIN